MSDSMSLRREELQSQVEAAPSMHPCAIPLLLWTALSIVPLFVAIRTGLPAWALLAVPPIALLTLLGFSVVRGRPTVGVDETLTLDDVLIEVGGCDAFGVTAQDETAAPVHMTRRPSPRIIASTDFVRGASDRVLQGVAALQHAELADVGLRQRATVLRIAQLALCFGAALAAAALAPADVVLLAAFAPLGCSLCLPGAALAAWSRLPWTVGIYAQSIVTRSCSRAALRRWPTPCSP